MNLPPAWMIREAPRGLPRKMETNKLFRLAHWWERWGNPRRAVSNATDLGERVFREMCKDDRFCRVVMKQLTPNFDEEERKRNERLVRKLMRRQRCPSA